jgi:hypothetical protein
LSALWFALGVIYFRSERGLGTPAYDTYSYFYPTVLYTFESLRSGEGLLWNPYQNCGQPFFAVSQTGVLYPLHVVFAFLDREAALLTSKFLHMSIAGVGTLLLCRTMGLGRSASLCGSFAFQLSSSTTNLAAYNPMVVSSYVWIPVIFFLLERYLRSPGLRTALLLGMTLTLQWLPGAPQVVFFTYQLIVLRTAWALLFDARRVRSTLLHVGLALALPFLLGAVQILPSIETALQSIRSGPLSSQEIGLGIDLSSSRWRARLLAAALPTALALVALTMQATAKRAVFFLLVAGSYFLLSLGPGTLLFDLYAELPLGRAFRGPQRFFWVSGFALSVLAALGTEAVMRERAGRRARPGLALAGLVALGVALSQIRSSPPALLWAWFSCVGLVVAVAGYRRIPRLAQVLLPLVVMANGLAFASSPRLGQRGGELYTTHEATFRKVKGMATSQDRVFVTGRYSDLSLAPKVASLFRMPGIHDYEPQVPRDYAEYFTYMRTGRALRGIDERYSMLPKLVEEDYNWRLFDVTAARFLILDRAVDHLVLRERDRFRLLFRAGAISVYENRRALPRAYYVPRLEVVPAAEVLPMLARGAVDTRRVALVSREPASGFRGSEGQPAATTEIVSSRAGEVVLRVRSSAPGFLFLADQYSPGWRAEVNGQPSPILKANHAFRLVEVGAGESLVVFRYRPLSVLLGGLVSLGTALAMGWAWARSGGSETRPFSEPQGTDPGSGTRP